MSNSAHVWLRKLKREYKTRGCVHVQNQSVFYRVNRQLPPEIVSFVNYSPKINKTSITS